jgi:NTE family protein
MTTAFVLTGGGSLGAVQVGMLQALAERGTRPDVLIGTSVGALNAAFVAGHGWSAPALGELDRVWRSLRRRDVFPARPQRQLLGALGWRTSLFSNRGLRRLIEKHLRFARLEDAAIPLHVIATNELDGKDVVLSSGDPVEAVLASAAIPALYPPIERDGMVLVDGGIANNAPISHAAALGCDDVVVLPTGYSCSLERPPATPLAHALHALTLLVQQRLVLDVVNYAERLDLCVVPPLCPLSISPADFRHSANLIDRARRAAGDWFDTRDTQPAHEQCVAIQTHHDAAPDQHPEAHASYPLAAAVNAAAH